MSKTIEDQVVECQNEIEKAEESRASTLAEYQSVVSGTDRARITGCRKALAGLDEKLVVLRDRLEALEAQSRQQEQERLDALLAEAEDAHEQTHGQRKRAYDEALKAWDAFDEAAKRFEEAHDARHAAFRLVKVRADRAGRPDPRDVHRPMGGFEPGRAIDRLKRFGRVAER